MKPARFSTHKLLLPCAVALGFALLAIFSSEPHQPDLPEEGAKNSSTTSGGSAPTDPSSSHILPTVAAPAGANLRPQEIDFDKEATDKIFSAKNGSPLEIALPDGKRAKGTVDYREMVEDLPGVGYVQGRLTFPQPGFFFFQRQSMPGVAGEIVGFIRFDEGDVAYRVDPTPAGPVLALHAVGDVFCAQLAPPPGDVEAAALPEEHPDPAIPGYQNGVVPLQSLPGSGVVLYLDYDGEDGPHAAWGNFDAAAPNVSNTQIRDVWERVAEDFAPFDINVTTDLQVYLDAAENSRQRCIVTPTTDASPGNGGVAILGSFNSTGDVPCWAFYASGKAGAEVISHELGHTLKLTHDGQTTPEEDYYAGHGSGDVGWAPIMGVGYFKNLTQWSKGEYLNAYADPTVPQDDLAVITGQNNNVDYRTDDHGDSFATASYLRILPGDIVESDGVIEKPTDGVIPGDIDVFRFTIPSSGSIDIQVSPVSDGPNLDIEASLYDSIGNLIVLNNPDPTLSAAIFSASLPADTYTVQITGAGLGDPEADGYTDYGSLGFYKITGTVTGADLPQRFAVAENTPIDEFIDDVLPQLAHSGDIYFYIDSGNELDIFYIDEEEGTLYVNDDTLLDFETLSSGYEQPEFELFIEIVDDDDEEFNELLRVIISVFDLNEPPTAVSGTTHVLEKTSLGTEVYQVSAFDPDYGDALTYAITSGDPTGSFAINPTTGRISVAGPVTTSTQLTILVTDSQSSTDQATVDVTLVPVSGPYIAGSIVQSFFEDIPGTSVADLTTDPKFPDSPDSELVLYEFNTDEHGDDYGSTLRGYLIPPVNGQYTFWLASDDAGQLFLSPDSTNNSLAQINEISGWTTPKNWTTPSNPINLVGGQAYYIEVRFKEGGGRDHASVAWQGPGFSQQLIPGKFLAPYFQNYAPSLEQASFSVQADAYAGTTIGTVHPIDVNFADTHSGYTIVSGNGSGGFEIDPVTGKISIAVRGAISVGQVHNLQIEVTDSGTPQLTGSSFVQINVTDQHSFDPGGIIREVWDGVIGVQVSALLADPRYPLLPSSSDLVTTGFDTDKDIDNDYGSRIRAYVVPPATGEYVFYICSDDNSQLFLSDDDSPDNAVQIADVPGWANPELWTKYPNQASNDPGNPNSKTINLVAGERYYIEALHKDGGGSDHLQVAWDRPDISGISIISGNFLEPYNPNLPPVWDQERYAFSIDLTVPVGHVIGSVTATDLEPVVYSILAQNNGAFAIDSFGTLTVADPGLLTPGRAAPLVGAQDAGNGGIYPFASSDIEVQIVVTNGGNVAPIAFPDVEFDIPTTSIPGTVVGEVHVTDSNVGELLTFSLDTPSPFAIDVLSGRITVAGNLDPENVMFYVLPFTVTDAGGLSAQNSVTVNLVVPVDDDADGLSDAWEVTHFGDFTSFGPQDDPDLDKLTNFYEMAFGSDPNINDESDQETIKLEPIPASNDVTLIYRRPRDFLEIGLVYEIFATEDLTTWELPVTVEQPAVIDPDGVTEWIPVRIITPPGTKYFLRVKVSQQSDGSSG